MNNYQTRFCFVLPSCLLVTLFVGNALAQGVQQLEAPLVQTETALSSEFAAVIRSGKSAVLSSQIEGLITEVAFAEGESFEEGDKLMSMDCTMPLAERKKARAHLRFVRQEHEANLLLSKLDSISDVALARSAVEVEKAAVESESTRYKVSQCDLMAPFSGTVVKWHVQQYENAPEKSQILEIVNNVDLRIEFLLPSKHLSRLENQPEFELYVLETDQIYSAEVLRVIPQVDSVSQTVKVIGQITENAETLWSGMSGFARFPIVLN